MTCRSQRYVPLLGESLTDAVIREVREETSLAIEPVAVTGGLATHIVPFCDEIDDTDDLLTLTGLRLLHERNA